jgi:hypothetical protein
MTNKEMRQRVEASGDANLLHDLDMFFGELQVGLDYVYVQLMTRLGCKRISLYNIHPLELEL